MFRSCLAAALATLILAAPAGARCVGSNQIDSLPPQVRADLTARVDAAAFPRGNFWRATRGDQIVTLIGTYHLDDARFDALMEPLDLLIDASTTVLVEAGPLEEAALQEALAVDPSLMFVMDGPTLVESLPPETWARLKDALSARGIPPFMGSRMQPAYLSMLLGIPPCAAEALTGGERGLDQRIIESAARFDVPLAALEPYDTIFNIFRALTPEDQREMLEMALAMDDQTEDAFATMLESYFRQDSRMIWEYSRWLTLQTPGMDPARVEADFAAMEASLMTERNRAWIPVIEAAAADGPVLAAFGALHLSGNDGVLALLERRGFTLERLDL
jgi:uncharacterized protein YbaP (TraB family)